MISAGFVWNTITQLDLLHQEIVRGERLVQTELRQVLPNTSASGVNAMLMELEEKIELRKAYIKNSKNFEKRDYHNLSFLKNISALLRKIRLFKLIVWNMHQNGFQSVVLLTAMIVFKF
ncbi:MAG: hypothetical protein Ct9H300mP21_06580 [Pseudomonadota bacterium]|nr:MAG: hypothetical protein Ct9H300mP21_06580 [Pseudomonadota bacterium]